MPSESGEMQPVRPPPRRRLAGIELLQRFIFVNLLPRMDK
jgi:hypothetical protein